ncbi:hypothetical protein [Niallia sp.]|uniref:hypothetical protein n=1 Tax=Niallia sp. TaxID=2837523 RepID=UPI0028A1304F|nr:hypothetical protein [Niallia sp.]
MPAKKNDQAWAESKKRCRLNDIEIQMAKELGMTPKVLIRNIPAPNQRWKAPVKVWIRDLYEEKFDKDVTVTPIPLKKLANSVKKKEAPVFSDSWIDEEDLPF